jgi:adhesin transport system outer membrane protein
MVGAGRRAAFALVVMLVGAFAASAAQATDLENEIQSLVGGHPQVRAAKENVDSANAAINAARSQFYPQAHVTGNTGPEHWNNSALVQTNRAPITAEGYQLGLTVTQHLYDGNATFSAVDAAIDNKAVTESTLRLTRQTTILEGVNAYLDVLRQSQLVKLSRTDEQRLQTQLHLEDERVQRGSGVAVDVLAAKHRLQLAKERRVGYEGALDQAIDRFQQVFGHGPDELGDRVPEPPAALVPESVDEAQKIALAENPSVEAAKRTVTLSGEKVNTARSGYFPTLDFVSKIDDSKNRDSIVGRSHDWEFLLQLNWDLFNGFKTQSQVSQAAHDLAASRDTASQAERKASEAVRLAWSQVQTARERVAILENAVNLAYEVWNSRQKMRESGKATVIDVLDAETDITNAQITYLTATFDRKIATYQLLFSLGRLESGNLDSPTDAGSAAPQPTPK